MDWTEGGEKMIRSDCKDLPGSPICGFGKTIEESIRSQAKYNRKGYTRDYAPHIEAILDALEAYPSEIHEYYISDLRKPNV